MSWTITPSYDGFTDDADATAYLAAVQAADGQVLEPAVRLAVNSFVKGCKADGIWTAIKASCILAGARTLSGALVPLVGTAPTNNNFVSGDYNRKTGLSGSSSNNTKYLNANRNHNQDTEINRHHSAYVSEFPSIPNASNVVIIAAFGGTTSRGLSQLTAHRGASGSGAPDQFFTRLSSNPSDNIIVVPTAGLIGTTKSSNLQYTLRNNKINTAIINANSAAPGDEATRVFSRNLTENVAAPRIAFYSIGESLDLALLDARVSALITAFGTAIPS